MNEDDINELARYGVGLGLNGHDAREVITAVLQHCERKGFEADEIPAAVQFYLVQRSIGHNWRPSRDYPLPTEPRPRGAECLTIAQIAPLLGVGPDAARKQLSRWGVVGVTHYPAEAVREAIAARPGRGNWRRPAAVVTQPADVAVWSLVRGESPTSRAVDPGIAGVDIPDEVLAWAEVNGLSDDDPDVYLLVTPAGEAGEVTGELAYMKHAMSPEDLALIRAELDA